MNYHEDQSILLGLGDWVPVISFESAKSFILPPIDSDIDIDKTKINLQAGGFLVGNRWKGLRPFILSENYQMDMELHLEAILKVIMESCAFKSPRRPTLEYRFTGNLDRPVERTEESRPYGFGQLRRENPESTIMIAGKDKALPDDWKNVAFAVEYQPPSRTASLALTDSKSNDKAVNERATWDKLRNCKKIIWGLKQMLFLDPRRRFTFGITLENTKGRVWHSNRSATLVTESFDLLEEADKFVYIALSLFYASPLDLGWDPTMTLRWNGQGFYYDIVVHDAQNPTGMVEKVYRIVRVLSESGARAFLGNGTRVYEAHPIDGLGNRCGENVVIKDGWNDDSKKTEEEILSEICKTVSEEDKRYFLTVVAGGDVLVNGFTDHTEKVIMHGLELDYHQESAWRWGSSTIKKRFLLYYRKPPNSKGDGHKTFRNYHGRRFGGKFHHRIVFKEIGIPIKHIKDLPTVLQCLIDLVKAVKILHTLGYVHRDISAGNILLVQPQSRGVLIDLEHVADLNSLEKHTPSPERFTSLKPALVGTPDFMAIEAKHNWHLFYSAPEKSQRGLEFINEADFFYNPLHDMESVWWIFVWVIVFSGTPLPAGEIEKKLLHAIQKQAEDQEMLAYSIFAGYMFNEIHDDMIMLRHPVESTVSKIILQDHVPYLTSARNLLVETYRKAEKRALYEGEMDKSVFLTIHGEFIDILQLALNASQGVALCHISELSEEANRRVQESEEKPIEKTGGKG